MKRNKGKVHERQRIFVPYCYIVEPLKLMHGRRGEICGAAGQWSNRKDDGKAETGLAEGCGKQLGPGTARGSLEKQPDWE